MNNPSFDIAPVTRAQVDNLLAQLTASGRTVTETGPAAWNIKTRVMFVTIEVNAEWAEPSILTVNVVHGPAGEIESGLRQQLGMQS
jgi:hypothetical protein